MKKSVLIFAAIFLMHCSPNKQATRNTEKSDKAIQIQFNKNVEFLGFTFFLGSLGEQYEHTEELIHNQIPKKEWYAYQLSLYQEYKSFRNNKNLTTVVQFEELHDGSDLILLLIQLDDFPNAKLTEAIDDRYLLPFSRNRDLSEAKANISRFIEAANQFYNEVNFDEYFSRHRTKYEHALQQIKAAMPTDQLVPAMEAFYRKTFEDYVLIPSLTIPTGMGFGPRLIKEGKISIYNVFGPLGPQRFLDESQLDMGFGNEKRLRELTTHEFGHSFVNPVVDQIPQELIAQSEYCFKPIEDAMAEQDYLTWKSCLYEHFVRAGEILIARNMENMEDAANLQHHYIKDRHFVYLPVIIEELEKYNANRLITYEEVMQRAIERLAIPTAKP